MVVSYESRKKVLAIADLTSAVFDNGRRGEPRPGCDCFQCFGYCLVDKDEAVRSRFQTGSSVEHRPAPGVPLDLEEKS